MTQTRSFDTAGRIVELDALRGLAALAVLIYHLPRGFWFGATGVDLFFVLSGFLITGIILRNRDQPGFLRTFYWRRSLRIFPIYYLALLVAVGINAVRSTPEETTGFPFYLVYLQHIHAYWGGVTPPANISLGHTWTLAIEEQFYLFWPIALVLSKRRATPWLVGLFIAMPVLLRHFGLPRNVLLGHTDGLALGALLAWIMARTESVGVAKKSACYAAIATMAFAGYWALWRLTSVTGGPAGNDYVAYNPAISLVSVGYFGLVGFVVCMSGKPSLGMLRNRQLVMIGSISYGLYLYHWILYEAIDTVIKFGMEMGDPIWLDGVKVITSFAVAIASWHLIEQPILSFKDHFDYSRNGLPSRQPELPSALRGQRAS